MVLISLFWFRSNMGLLLNVNISIYNFFKSLRHLLQTVFRLISLADRIDIDVRRDGNIVRETDMVGVPHDEDLVVRAARALQAHTGTKLGAQIKVKKNIPAGGGLGGGSSDAATVLLALNRLWETRLSRAA